MSYKNIMISIKHENYNLYIIKDDYLRLEKSFAITCNEINKLYDSYLRDKHIISINYIYAFCKDVIKTSKNIINDIMNIEQRAKKESMKSIKRQMTPEEKKAYNQYRYHRYVKSKKNNDNVFKVSFSC